MTENIEEIDALLIERIADLDAAAKRVENHIQKQISTEIDKAVSSWISNRGTEWIGNYDWFDAGIFIAPIAWSSEDKTHQVDSGNQYFYLTAAFDDKFDGSDTVDYFWLTRLCKAGKGSLGFTFVMNEVKKNKPIQRAIFSKYQSELEEFGFIIQDGLNAFLPVSIDASVLANALLTGNFSELKQIIEKTLDNLEKAIPAFSRLAEQCRN